MARTKMSPKEEFAQEFLSDVLQYACKMKGDELTKMQKELWQEWKDELLKMVDVAIKVAQDYRFRHQVEIEDPEKLHPLIVLIVKFVNLCNDKDQKLNVYEFFEQYSKQSMEVVRLMLAMAEVVLEGICYRKMLKK